jgi:hypothetical protein
VLSDGDYLYIHITTAYEIIYYTCISSRLFSGIKCFPTQQETLWPTRKLQMMIDPVEKFVHRKVKKYCKH